MPPRHSIKNYQTFSLYHIVNRGIDKRDIFQDDEDYWKFLDIVRSRLLSKPKDPDNPKSVSEEIYGKIELVAYCLMPNHFHLIIFQKSQRAMEKFMRSISTAYAMYFNKKYGKSGRLMQGIYKAKKIDSREYFLKATRYVHRNPIDISENIEKYKWSSYRSYLMRKDITFLAKSHLLKEFGNNIDNLVAYTNRDDPFEG